MSNGTNRPSGAGASDDDADETTGRKKRGPLSIIAWTLGILGSLVPLGIIAMALAFLFVYVTVDVPAPENIKQNQRALILDSSGKEIAAIVPQGGNRTIVKIDDIPKSMQDAVIAAEDRDFEQNSGFSVRGLGRAAWRNVTNQPDAGGGSTITQQYVKNALVGDERSFKRKFNELAIATKMSTKWSKEEILAAYLNTIYFGRGAYGVAAAAQSYFGKSVKNLTTSESALLAAVIRSPSYYDPSVNPEASEGRWRYVVDGMVKIGALNQADAGKLAFPSKKDRKYKRLYNPVDDPGNVTKGPNGLIKRQVLSELPSLGISEQQVQTEGLKITTSIDPKVQKAAVEAGNGKLQGEPKQLRSSVVSIDPRTGGVKGYFGGNDGQGYDYAQAGLQTGSSFKVFALVAALEQGIPMSKVYNASPFTNSSGQTITNSDGESCGSCNLATALKMSLNTVYYRLTTDLKGQGKAVAEAAHKAGVAESFGSEKKTLQNPNGTVENGVVLGQYVSRVIDMASSYATLANSGIYRKPYFVQKVESSDGTVLYEREKDAGERRIPKDVAENVTAAMEPIASYSNGHGLGYGSRPSAAKTGTAQLGDTGKNKDAWMVGYTPQLSTAVWVGTDKGTALQNLYGASIYGSGLPSDIWQSAMNGALDGEDVENFPTPNSINGVAGVPYEPPPTTQTPTETREEGPSSTRTETTRSRRPSQPRITLPGITIPLPGDDGGSGGGNGGGNGNGNGNGRGGNRGGG